MQEPDGISQHKLATGRQQATPPSRVPKRLGRHSVADDSLNVSISPAVIPVNEQVALYEVTRVGNKRYYFVEAKASFRSLDGASFVLLGPQLQRLETWMMVMGRETGARQELAQLAAVPKSW
jgi:hypothetical protein